MSTSSSPFPDYAAIAAARDDAAELRVVLAAQARARLCTILMGTPALDEPAIVLALEPLVSHAVAREILCALVAEGLVCRRDDRRYVWAAAP